MRPRRQSAIDTIRHGHAPAGRSIVPVVVLAAVLLTGLGGCSAQAEPSLGHLRVTTDPPLPAQISLNGEIADSWGLWLKLAPGSYTVHFSHVEGFTEPADQHVTVTDGQTTTTSGTFVRRGSLRVITDPPMHGQVIVDGIPRNSKGIWTDLPTGKHEVCFGTVLGYDPPDCQDVHLEGGKLTTVAGTYTKDDKAPLATGVGYLRVATDPALPAQISLNGTIADSWSIDWLKLVPGSYTVHYGHVEGYTEPADEVVTVNDGAPTVAIGTYAARGALHVMTDPAVPGTITVDGIPRDDMGMWTDLPTGSHRVCFGDVAGFVAPPCQSVTVQSGTLATVTGVYH